LVISRVLSGSALKVEIVRMIQSEEIDDPNKVELFNIEFQPPIMSRLKILRCFLLMVNIRDGGIKNLRW
jgi:hypothetical protein